MFVNFSNLSIFKKKLLASKLRDKSIDALAALKMAERCLHGPPSNVRLLVAKIAFDASHGKNKLLSIEQIERFRLLMQRIELITDFQYNTQQICDTSFLYWHQSLLKAYLRQIVDKKLDFHSFQVSYHILSIKLI